MRIVLIGQAAFGQKILEALLNRGEQVAAVYAPPDKPGSKIDSLKESAQQRGIPVFQPQRMRDPAVYEKFTELAPDLCVMAFVTDIVPESVLNAPKLGTIQYHPSLLPRHRGRSSINWAIINGDTKTGITILWPDAGIDTGPILLQKEVDISPTDTVGSLYYDKLFPLGIEAIMESIDLIQKGQAPRIPQDESQATYERPCGEKDALIDWAQPVVRVYNLIRGTNPQPGATTSLRGQKLKIFDCELTMQKIRGTPGEIIESSDKGIAVAGQGGRLLIKRVQLQGQSKMSASEYALKVGLKVGERLERWQMMLP
jgi:methionyl-tRNA formyltransferase